MVQIGILQLTQFLDDTVAGFKQGLRDKNIAANFHYRNADGNVTRLKSLAHELTDARPDLIFACSTPAAQAVLSLRTAIPVLFAPVLDPVGSGLVEAFDLPGGLATGMSGMVPADAKVGLIQALLPHAAKIGVLYHRSDQNMMLDLTNFLKSAANRHNCMSIFVDCPVQLSMIMDRFSAHLDLLYVPAEKIFEENFATIFYYAELLDLPILASSAASVASGALAALTADHYRLGYECAAKAELILAGHPPGSIPVGIVKEPDIFLNAETAGRLGIKLPPALTAKAKVIYS